MSSDKMYLDISIDLYQTPKFWTAVKAVWWQLTPAQKLVLENRVWKGMTLKQVSVLFDKMFKMGSITPEAVRQHQQAGLKKIKKLLSKMK